MLCTSVLLCIKACTTVHFLYLTVLWAIKSAPKICIKHFGVHLSPLWDWILEVTVCRNSWQKDRNSWPCDAVTCTMGMIIFKKIKTFSTNFIRAGGTRSLDYLTISQTPYPSVVTKHKLRWLQISLLVYIYICLWQIQAGNAAVRLAAGLPSESRRARASKLSQMSTPPLSGPGPTDLVPAPTVAWVSCR